MFRGTLLKIEVPGRRKTGKPQRRFVVVAKVDLQRVGVAVMLVTWINLSTVLSDTHTFTAIKI